jgi:hypothetical protein
LTFKNPKSGDNCNRFCKVAADVSTDIDAYVCPLNTRSYVPFAAGDAVANVVTVAL